MTKLADSNQPSKSPRERWLNHSKIFFTACKTNVSAMNELRIPSRLLSDALASKQMKQLRLFAAAKLEGHRSEIKPLCARLKIQPKTCQRLIKKLVADQWAGTDGKFLFPRSWRKLEFSKRGGLYLTETPKDLKEFEALCFARALKKVYRKLKSPHSSNRRILQEDFSTRYLCKSLRISERRFERLKATAAKLKFIRVKPQKIEMVGKANQVAAWSKNYPDRTCFTTKAGYCYSPEISKIKVLI
jgi:hypothetical protein